MTLPNIFTIDFLKALTVRNYQQKAGTSVYKNVAVDFFFLLLKVQIYVHLTRPTMVLTLTKI